MKKLLSFSAALLLLMTVHPSFAQYDAWTYRMPVSVTENSGTTLNNFQVLLRINTQTLINQGKMNPDGSDIRFANNCDGAGELAYFIERWLGTDSTEIWVRIPTLTANNTFDIYMFYGNGSAIPQSNFGAVFPNSYKLGLFDFDFIYGVQTYDWFETEYTSNILVLGGAVINARRIIIHGDMDGDGFGYQGGDDTPTDGSGPGGGGFGTDPGPGAGGGGYGADGGRGGYDNNDPLNGGLANGTNTGFTIDAGSGGGGNDNGVFGGNGGAYVAVVGKSVEVTGFISMNGEDGEDGNDNGGGGGAGGGVLIAGHNLVYSGFCQADGGRGGDGNGGDDDAGGGGSGGRFKIFAENSAIITGGAVANGGRGGNGGGGNEDGEDGNDGTIIVDVFTSTEPSAVVGSESYMPKADFVFTTPPVCWGDTVDFTNTGSADTSWTYEWIFGSGASPATDSLQNPDNVTYTEEGMQPVTFIVNDGLCADTSMQWINVVLHPLPDANAGPDDSITVGNWAQLVATGGIQYEWSPAWGLDNAGIYNPMAGPDTSTTYTVTVTDIYGCVQMDTMRLTVLTPGFWFPDAFTPDADGLNDIFYVRGEGVSDFEFRIFDQWGHIVFQSRNLDTGWDGNRQPGDDQMPEGAYIYVVTGTLSDGGAINENGLVNLIR